MGTIQREKFVSENEVKSFCDSLKETALKNCITDDQKRGVKELTINNLLSWQVLYEKDGKFCQTNAYDLLGKNSLWCAKIQCAVFKGSDRTVFIDRREFTGSIQQQVEDAYNFVLRNIRLGAVINGLYRQDVYEIPPAVIRELIINAVVHRNYLESSHIQISIFDDRLEITSPGSLLKGVTIERMRQGFSKARNESLANVFHYMHLIEQWGTGIPRIVNLLKASGLDEPEFIDMEVAIRTNIYRKSGDKAAINSENGDKAAINSENGDKTAINLENGDKTAINSENGDKTGDKPTIKKDVKFLIIEYLKNHGECSAKELADMLGLKASRTKVYLNNLVESGKIIAKGANKNRTYVLDEAE